MDELINSTVEEIVKVAAEEGIDLSAEEIAELAAEKIAQESEEGESAGHEASESSEKEEGEKEEGAEEAKEDAAEEASEEEKKEAAAYIEAVVDEISKQAEAEGVDLTAEDLAKVAAEAIEKQAQLPAGEAVEEAMEAMGKSTAGGSVPAEALKRVKPGLLQRFRALSGGKKALVVGGGLAAATGAGLGIRALLKRKGQKKAASDVTLDKQAEAQLEADIVKEARSLLVMSGFNPDTGEPLEKVALAQDRDELVKVAARELLEQAGWPIQWDPAFLARALKEEG